MTENLSVESVIAALEKIGRDTGTAWADGHPDYVAEYSLTAEHIPALIETATTCSDASADDSAVYAQIHAWRALAQLRAVEAVQPLLEVQEELDERNDDWYLEEFHLVFGLIGPPACRNVGDRSGSVRHPRHSRCETFARHHGTDLAKCQLLHARWGDGGQAVWRRV